MDKPKYEIGDSITKDKIWIISDMCCMDGRCSYEIYRTSASAYLNFEDTAKLEEWIDWYDNYERPIPLEDRPYDYYIY